MVIFIKICTLFSKSVHLYENPCTFMKIRAPL
nr:MAG TPA: hypothetical protein [Inoviridae sp.]